MPVRWSRPEWYVDRAVSHFLDPSDAIVVTGFWRSGTSWLLQSLARGLRAKSVFEPFHLSLPQYQSALHDTDGALPEREAFLHYFMPYIGEESNGTLKAYSSRALTSALPSRWLREARWGSRNHEGRVSSSAIKNASYRIAEAMRSAVVVKFVRGHLMVPALVQWFAPAIVHIRRDPRAVVHSAIRYFNPWWRTLSLKEQLLDVQDGRASFFSKWSAFIEETDQRPPPVRLAAYWALVERYAQEHWLPDARASLRYETLCIEGVDYLQRATGRALGWQPRSQHLGGRSVSTESASSKKARLYGWKDGLSAATIRGVEEVVERMGLEDSFYA